MDAPHIRPNLTYPITNPKNKKTYYPPKNRCWRFTQDNFLKELADNRIVFGKKGISRPQYKRFLSEAEEKGRSISTIWDNVGTATNGTDELATIFPTDQAFDTPKPSSLLKMILMRSTTRNSIILDSFAGSGTTAHATLALNKEDGGNRKFILVECEDYADTVTAERVRRVIKGIPNAKDKDLNAGLGGDFTYCELGEATDIEKLLSGKALPSFKGVGNYTVPYRHR